MIRATRAKTIANRNYKELISEARKADTKAWIEAEIIRASYKNQKDINFLVFHDSLYNLKQIEKELKNLRYKTELSENWNCLSLDIYWEDEDEV